MTIALKAGAAALCGYLTLRFLLPWLAPFLAAGLLAAAVEPAVGFLSRRRWPRGLAAGAMTALLLGVAGGLVWLCVARAAEELRGFAEGLPALMDAIAAKLAAWDERLTLYPGGLLRSLSGRLGEAPELLSKKLLSLASALASRLPEALLFLVAMGIGMYFISASMPEIRAFLARQLPEEWAGEARELGEGLRAALFGWLRAQLILTGITFAEVLISLTLLRVRYAALLAALTAVVDALPVFGAGTVLLPWAAWELLAGDYATGLLLTVTWAVVMLLRNCIQAKLLGDELGLHPLVTLIAIYVGFRVGGVWGMVAAPIAAVVIKQLADMELLRLWNT